MMRSPSPLFDGIYNNMLYMLNIETMDNLIII